MNLPHLKILLYGIAIFVCLGPLLGLLATGIFPLLAYSVGALPALLVAFPLCFLRCWLTKPILHWQQHWPSWLFSLVAFLPGAFLGSAFTLLYSRSVMEPLLYNEWTTLYLGGIAAGLCNILFWQLRFSVAKTSLDQSQSS